MLSYLRSLWCHLTHGTPMLPINGYYECRVCQRRYPVQWGEKPVREGDRRKWVVAPEGE